MRIGVEPDGSLAARLGRPEDPSRTQTLRAPARACPGLIAATAIAVSLVIRAAASARPAPPPALAPGRAPPENRGLPPPEPPRAHHSLASGLVLGGGVVPGLAAGALFTYGLRWKTYFGVAVDASTTTPGRPRVRMAPPYA